MKKKEKNKKLTLGLITKSIFWFLTGALLGLFLFLSFSYIIFQRLYENKVYPGVRVEGIDFGGKSEDFVKKYYADKNAALSNLTFEFVSANDIATISAKELEYGYNENLISTQAINVGRSKNLLSDIRLIGIAYLYNFDLSPTYQFSSNKLETLLSPIFAKLTYQPIDALFSFENGRVSAFKLSQNGQAVDKEQLIRNFEDKAAEVFRSPNIKKIIFTIPLKKIEPKVSTEDANNLGVTELIASGTSLFQGSIPNRIYNITLASSRMNGSLIKPGEEFSFNKTIGDISSFTGYKQAYVIQNGRTVLGDGGGVCQVSTTLFRAILNAGLPITERHPHAYRVGYYEQDSSPGLDASVYTPTLDLKFKNDTKNHILIQTEIDQNTQRLTFNLYGTKDGRTVTIEKPIILSQSPAPAPLYQDDPTLPKGEIRQIDFAAAGANVVFSREVQKDGKVIISEKFASNFRPWQAIYLRGTKE